MMAYKWEGVTRDGKEISGSEEAKSEKDLKRALRARGILARKIKPPGFMDKDIAQILVEKGFAAPFGPTELLNFTKQISVMISAGVPILQTLEILFKQEKNPTLKVTIKKVATLVGSGKSFSDALKEQKGFSDLYCNLVKAGEASGVLDEILDKLAIYLEKQEKIKAQVKGALTYPVLVCGVGAIVIYAMLAYVVPKFTEMLTSNGQELPAITQLVIDVSNFLQEYGIYIVIGVFIALMVLARSIKTPVGKPVWDHFVMQVPIFGSIAIKGSLTSFTRTLSTMLVSGVSLIDSLEICAQIIDNTVIAKDVRKVKKALSEGSSFADPLMKIGYFPEMIAQMVRVGEQTGNLDKMLERIADIFEKDVEETVGTATKLIEPLILVVLGGIVAVILVAMYLPMFMSAGGAEGG